MTTAQMQGAGPQVMTRRRSLQCLAAWPCAPALAAQTPAHGVQLAHNWPPGRSPVGYLVSEKCDGVRAVWDGQVLRFRSGRPLAAPEAFLAALPRMALDGELWLGRGQFDRTSALVRKAKPLPQPWQALTYQVFDAPAAQGTFAQRHAFLQAHLLATPVPGVVLLAQAQLPDADALQRHLAHTVQQGGEGLVLHRADALWQAGRTGAVFKLKPAPDEEGQVVGYVPGQGRLQGQTGALLLQTPQGQRFALGAGLSDALRRQPPPTGAWVTYRYLERTPSGLPRFASFVRVRPPE